MTPTEFLPLAWDAALKANHIWPGYAACEAALESGWNTSRLALKANNLFGQKQGFSTTNYPKLELPTHEVIDGKLVPATAFWPIFPDWQTCFSERMNLLRRMSAYGPALAAPTGEAFVHLVSAIWATDPQRGDKVLAIYKTHEGLLSAAPDPDGSISV